MRSAHVLLCLLPLAWVRDQPLRETESMLFRSHWCQSSNFEEKKNQVDYCIPLSGNGPRPMSSHTNVYMQGQGSSGDTASNNLYLSPLSLLSSQKSIHVVLCSLVTCISFYFHLLIWFPLQTPEPSEILHPLWWVLAVSRACPADQRRQLYPRYPLHEHARALCDPDAANSRTARANHRHRVSSR